MHGSPKNLRSVRRGTSNDPSTLHQYAAWSRKARRNAMRLLPAAMNVMEGKSTYLDVPQRFLHPLSFSLSSMKFYGQTIRPKASKEAE